MLVPQVSELNNWVPSAPGRVISSPNWKPLVSGQVATLLNFRSGTQLFFLGD